MKKLYISIFLFFSPTIAYANIVSGVIGLIARPLSGIAYELSLGMLINWLFSWGTFNPVAWVFVPIFSGATNAGIELGTLRLIWKEKINRKRFILTSCINAITVGIATVWVILQPPKM
jgi:Na+/citrate or Na+/malate symporter